MNAEVIDLSEEEIQVVAGAGEIDPSMATSSVQYPEIENEPPPV